MDKKHIPLESDETKYKKRAAKKSQSRSDHKHEYKTVLLIAYSDHPFKQGEKLEHKNPTKVCQLCGRVGKVDYNYYKRIPCEGNKHKYYQSVIINEAELDVWCCDFFDKVAVRKTEAKPDGKV